MEKENLWIPCGKCPSCRVSRSREWTIRLLHEYAYHESTAFITLTYDDENLPENESVDKKELQRVIRQLRDQKENIVKYYAIGEYGEEKGRPHYHGIMFGLGRKDTELIENTWKKGIISVDSVTQYSIRYVTDYIHKENWIELYDYRTPPFSLQSQGLGKRWALENKEHLIQNIGTTMNGQKIGIPKYYQKILDIDRDPIIQLAKEKSQEYDQSRYEYLLKNNVDTVTQKTLHNKQRALNLNAKNQIKKKGIM